MSDPNHRKRSPISVLLAIVVVLIALAAMAVMKVNNFFRRKYVRIDELKFPVLVFQPEGARVFAEWDSTNLEKFPEKSLRTPVDGTIIVDSDFNQFTQENVVRQREGDFKWMARFLLPGLRVKYKFDLRRSKTIGREALVQLLQNAPPFSEDKTEDSALRSAGISQSTMPDILNALHFYKPIEPASQPAELPPAPTTQDDTTDDPDNP